MEFHFKWFICI